MAILDHFGALWRPPMAIPDPGKGPNTSPQMCTDLIQPRSTLIHQFGAARPAYGPKRSISGNFGPFWGPMAPPNGHSGPGKGSQHIVPDVHGLDPTSIHADPPVWSRQACIWPDVPFMAIFGQFLAIKRVKMAGSKAAGVGSRSNSTPLTRCMY